MENFARWWVEWHREIKVGLFLAMIGSLAWCVNAEAAEWRLGAAIDAVHEKGATGVVLERDFGKWYAGLTYFPHSVGDDEIVTVRCIEGTCDNPTVCVKEKSNKEAGIDLIGSLGLNLGSGFRFGVAVFDDTSELNSTNVTAEVGWLYRAKWGATGLIHRSNPLRRENDDGWNMVTVMFNL